MDNIEIINSANNFFAKIKGTSTFASIDSFCDEIGLSKKEFETWGAKNRQEYDRFIQNLKIHIQDLASQGEITPQQFALTMKNEFGWSNEKKEEKEGVIIKEEDLIDDMDEWIEFKESKRIEQTKIQ